MKLFQRNNKDWLEKKIKFPVGAVPRTTPSNILEPIAIPGPTRGRPEKSFETCDKTKRRKALQLVNEHGK